MQVVSVINYKGGVGKTTLTANIGAELAWRGKKILLIDMDAQASLSFSFITPQVWKTTYADTHTIKQWFESIQRNNPVDLDSLVIIPPRINNIMTGKGELHLIVSHLGLINVDLELATQLGGATLSLAKQAYLKVHSQLRRALQDLENQDYDLILIDCPPNFNIVTKNAIAASDSILIPARPDYLSTMGIDYLIRSVNELVHDFNEFATHGDGNQAATIAPSLLGVVFTMIQVYGGQPIAAQRTFINQTRQLPGISVFKAWLRTHPGEFADAPVYGVPVVIHGEHSGVVEELENITSEFAAKVGL